MRFYALDIDFVVMTVIAENMCRNEVCPCPAEFEAQFLEVDEETLKQFKRTKKPEDTNDDDGSIQLYFESQSQDGDEDLD